MRRFVSGFCAIVLLFSLCSGYVVVEKDIKKVTKNNEADSFFDDLEKLLKEHQSKKEELESTLKEILKELRK